MSAAEQLTEVQVVRPEQVKLWLDDDQVVLVDIRTPAEHGTEKIPGSVLLPMERFDVSQLPQAEGKRMVIYCRTGNRSSKLGHKLLESGQLDHVLHLNEGLEGWKRAGLPVEKGQTRKLSVMQQVQLTIGMMVLIGTLLGAFVSPWWLLLPGGASLGMILAGLTGSCALASMMAKLPYNQRA